jgi:hypothetical protein
MTFEFLRMKRGTQNNNLTASLKVLLSCKPEVLDSTREALVVCNSSTEKANETLLFEEYK